VVRREVGLFIANKRHAETISADLDSWTAGYNCVVFDSFFSSVLWPAIVTAQAVKRCAIQILQLNSTELREWKTRLERLEYNCTAQYFCIHDTNKGFSILVRTTL